MSSNERWPRLSARRAWRVLKGFSRAESRPGYMDALRDRLRALGRGPRYERCVVCGEPRARVVLFRRRSTGPGGRRKLWLRICEACQHVANPENVHDYRSFKAIDKLPMRARVGRADRPGREYHMARMGIDILRDADPAGERRDVLVYGAGRSVDNHHIAGLSGVATVAVGDIMQLRDDAPFVDIGQPPTRRFELVIASEVVEHFIDPGRDFPHLFDFVEPDGLLVCSTNVHDGSEIGRIGYPFIRGHTSYYSEPSLRILAAASGFHLDLRIPLVATGYGGPRKRYLLFSRSEAVMSAIERYFVDREYAPSEPPWPEDEVVRRRTRPRRTSYKAVE